MEFPVGDGLVSFPSTLPPPPSHSVALELMAAIQNQRPLL